MSMCHWIVEGVGFDCGKLWDYLNKEKCIAFIEKHIGYEFSDEEKENFDINEMFEDYIEEQFCNIGEAFAVCDETNLTGFGDNGQGDCFYLYWPRYPWQHRPNEPHSIEEVHEILKKAVHVLCDISDEELDELLDDDIYEYGCG